MFNPAARVQWIEWAPPYRVAVIDDALLDPRALRELSMRHRDAFSAPGFNAYPGVELPLPDRVGSALHAFLAERGLTRQDEGLAVQKTTVRLSMATLHPGQLSPLQQGCHRDRLPGLSDDGGVVACVLYLFDNPDLGGTAFYRPRLPESEVQAKLHRWAQMSSREFELERGRPAAYLSGSDDVYELVGVVPARLNRLICYDGGLLHTSHIEHPELLSEYPDTGRLTLNGFLAMRHAMV